MIMVEHIKMMQIPYLDIWPILLSGQVPHRINSSHLFWNLEDPVLVQTLFYWRKITHQLLLIVFFINLFQCRMLSIICCIYMQFNSFHHSKFMHQWVIPRNNAAELHRQFIFAIDLNKIFARLTQVKNKGWEAWHTIFRTYIGKWSKGTFCQ